MQSYLYIHKERTKGIYTQMVEGIVAKKISEKSASFEAIVEGGIWAFLKGKVKGKKGGKIIIEKLTEPENMVADLVRIVPETGWTKLLVGPADWDFISKGDLVVFQGNLEIDSYSLSKGELREELYAKRGEMEARYDLMLKGQIGGKVVEIPFSLNWITGPSQFSMLCHSRIKYLEGLAVIYSRPDTTPVLMQPLAFGDGFVQQMRSEYQK